MAALEMRLIHKQKHFVLRKKILASFISSAAHTGLEISDHRIHHVLLELPCIMKRDDWCLLTFQAKYSDDIDAKRESAINRDRHKHIPELYLLRLINMKVSTCGCKGRKRL